MNSMSSMWLPIHSEKAEPVSSGPGVHSKDDRPGFALRLSSRIGAWGLLGGILASVSPQLGLSLPVGLSGVIGGIGVLAGGLGISIASSLVLKETLGTRLTRIRRCRDGEDSLGG